MLSTDFETGELECMQISNDIQQPEYDMETGESEIDNRLIIVSKPKFAIPRKLICRKDSKSKCCVIDPDQNFTLSKKEDVITLQEEIILGYNKTSYRLFLLVCGLFVCLPFVAVLMIIMEIAIHTWAHKKNSLNFNPNIYYRSPLHIYTSQFCQACRHEADMDKVIKLQEMRLKSCPINLRNVARNIY